MTTKRPTKDNTPPLFKPVAGPPESKSKGKYTALYEYLESHPGEWVVVEDQSHATQVTNFKKRGYEATSKVSAEGRFDIYVRKPA